MTTARALPLALPEESTKIAIFVEPSPFSHVSGMKIRFLNLIKGLRELGNDVTVVTPCVNPPKQFCGAKVRKSAGHTLCFNRTAGKLMFAEAPALILLSDPGSSQSGELYFTKITV